LPIIDSLVSSIEYFPTKKNAQWKGGTVFLSTFFKKRQMAYSHDDESTGNYLGEVLMAQPIFGQATNFKTEVSCRNPTTLS